MAMQPQFGQSGYITRAVSRVPNLLHGEKKQKWLCSPNKGKVATSPLRSRGSPTIGAGRKSINGYASRVWTIWPHLPCHLRGPKHSAWGERSHMALRHKCGQDGYITPAVSAVWNADRGDRSQKWLYSPNVE